jgi:hypothetical protein
MMDDNDSFKWHVDWYLTGVARQQVQKVKGYKMEEIVKWTRAIARLIHFRLHDSPYDGSVEVVGQEGRYPESTIVRDVIILTPVNQNGFFA